MIRLSSLGDVILATSALSVESGAGTATDWVVSREYSVLLNGHPKLGKVWTFDRKKGFSGWIELGKALWTYEYDEVLDLHASLRSRILQVLFFVLSIAQRKKRPKWKRVSKQRWRLYGYFVFKRVWPASWRPTPMVERFSRAAGGMGTERPDLRHLVSNDFDLKSFPVPRGTVDAPLKGHEGYLCVMPGSLWGGKRWPVDRFAEVLRSLPLIPVILGTQKDQESFELRDRLAHAGVPFISGIGEWSLREVATALSQSRGYIGNDTGLAHLAEAVGVPARVVFGPTAPAMGFGPWRPESKSFGSTLWCRPCGKDGRYCFRVTDRYRCLREVEPKDVLTRW